MMIVSNALRLIFVHVPKAAGSSIARVLQDLDPLAVAARIGPHEPIAKVREAYPEEARDFTSFAVVRNPWDRAVSLYHYRRKVIGQENWPVHWPSRNEVASMKFGDVVLRSRSQSVAGRNICPPRHSGETHWLEPSCHAWISIGGSIAVDRVCRLETLDRDFRDVGAAVGLDFPVLPVVNASVHHGYRDYYNDETRAIVAEHFRADIEAFGYTF